MKTKNSRLAKKLFLNMINLLGLKAEVEHDEHKKIVTLSIKSQEAGRLIGRNGVSLNSLNLLMNKILSNLVKNFPKLNLNITQNNTRSKFKLDDIKKMRQEKLEKHSIKNVYNIYLEDGKSEEKIIKQRKQNSLREKPKDNNTTEKHCQNALKELKRWGEDVLLPPIDIKYVDEVLDFFAKIEGIEAIIDEKKSFKDKKRIRINNKKLKS